MEAGEYETNTLLLTNIATVEYRVYESSTELSKNLPTTSLEFEGYLRENGHLAFYDPNRKGVWCFRIREKDTETEDGQENWELDTTIKVSGQTYAVAEEGVLDPVAIQKGRSQSPSVAPASTIAATPTGISSSTGISDQGQRSPFGTTTNASLSVPGKPQTGSSQGTDSQVKGNSALVYENFIAAVLLATSTAICPISGAIPLNYRTILFITDPSSSSGAKDVSYTPRSAFGTLTAYLTTIGTLVVSIRVSQCKDLLSLENLFTASFSSPGGQVLAAPFGIRACNPSAGVDDFGVASLAQTPNTQALSFYKRPAENDDGSWKQACLKILQLRGIPPSLLKGCSWVNVTVAKHRLQDGKHDTPRNRDVTSTTILPWPGPLCFRWKAVNMPTATRLRDTILSGHEESRDPLGSAGRWLEMAEEREEQITKRKAERSALEHSENQGARPQPLIVTEEIAPSTIVRPNTAPVSAMYPTPPDAIQQQNGVTPTFDAAVTSPRNPVAATAPVALEDMPQTEPEGNTIDSGEGDLWDRSEEPKRERSGSSTLGDSMLMEGDMFGENDITEADFNFFDDEDEGDLDLDMADLDAPAPDPSSADNPMGQSDVKLEEAPQNPPEAPEAPLSPEKPQGFTKPELRHARSFLSDPQTTRLIGEEKKAGLKREPSPFNPETVFKRVRASFSNGCDTVSDVSQRTGRRASEFQKIDFGPVLPMINKKYEKGGLYDYTSAVTAHQKGANLRPGALPETDYLKRHAKRTRKPKDSTAPTSSLMKNFTALEVSTSQPSPMRIGRSPSEDDASSVESDQDDSSYTSEDLHSPTKASFKGTNIDEDAVSQITFFRDSDALIEPDQRLALELPKFSKPSGPELNLSKLLMDPEPLSLELPMADDDIIQIAQLLTQQAATGSLEILESTNNEIPAAGTLNRRQQSVLCSRNMREALQNTMFSPFRRLTPATFKDLLEIPDLPAQGQPRSLQPRTFPGRDPNAEQLKLSSVYQIPCHHLEMRRSETKLSVLPSAVTFWESLGLAPASGNKDVYALCVFPGWSGMKDNTRTFLERMKSLYELLKLGTFEKVPLPNEFESGLLPYEVDRISTSPDASVTRQGSALIESMDVLQATLADLPLDQANIVIFMVYTPSSPGTVVEACLAFQRFTESCRPLLAAKGENAQRDFVLQLISADLISSPNSLVITPSSDLVKLCIELYDRCGPLDCPMSRPAILLEQPPPRLIEFKLTGSASASLIHENSCLHVAYAQSIDERWVTAAWTDDRGQQQGTASYCLGRKGRPVATSIDEVAREIWELTMEFIAHRKVHWRIIITKSGPMDTHEVESWSDLARNESKANVALVLMTVDTNPSIQLLPPSTQISSATAGFYTTPVSTPQANIVSPEQSGTPATPMRDANAATAPTPSADSSGEPEGDSILLDLTDQTWGAVLGHRLSNSTTLLELHPALVSGYLVKKVGSKIEDPPVVMEVNLVHTEGTARAYEPLFREMLSNFRGLGTLARSRGVVDMETDARPWHIAASEKAVRVLHTLM